MRLNTLMSDLIPIINSLYNKKPKKIVYSQTLRNVSNQLQEIWIYDKNKSKQLLDVEEGYQFKKDYKICFDIKCKSPCLECTEYCPYDLLSKLCVRIFLCTPGLFHKHLFDSKMYVSVISFTIATKPIYLCIIALINCFNNWYKVFNRFWRN